MLRMPLGLRDRVAKRAAENGRSLSAEIIAATEKHLAGADRLQKLEAFYEKWHDHVESIADMWRKLEKLESKVSDHDNALYPDKRSWLKQ